MLAKHIPHRRTRTRRSYRRAAACPPPKNDRRHQNNTANLVSRQLNRGDARQDLPPLVRPCGNTTRVIPEKEKAASVGERFMRLDYPYVSSASGLGEWRVGVLSWRLTALAARRGSLPDQCFAGSPLEECASSTDTRSDWHVRLLPQRMSA